MPWRREKLSDRAEERRIVGMLLGFSLYAAFAAVVLQRFGVL